MADAQHTYITLANLQYYHQRLINYIDEKAAIKSDMEEVINGFPELHNSYQIRYYDNFNNPQNHQETLRPEGSVVTIANNPFTREGYIFNSWNTASDGTGTPYAPGATLILRNDVNLYAIWTEIPEEDPEEPTEEPGE